jgi:uncharacterized protein YyaL (SSP411 family)
MKAAALKGLALTGAVALLLALVVALPAGAQETPGSTQPPAKGGGWRLAESQSPYLREHADNPVEWYPWGPEAFARARELDRPVFLSIGYLACHWCHRMEHDTFEDSECARLLNEHFVSIKVDREERPDIDSRYLQALAVITGSGGWPANLFLTPEGQAFAGGTYFAPEETPQTPGFREVLATIAEIWRTQRDAVRANGRDLFATLLADPLPAAGSFDPQPLLDKATVELAGSLDSEKGGTFGAPKFPPPLTLSWLLREHLRSGVDVVPLVRTTLDAMSGGALHDHVGGGFHRYCVDGDWKLPHFEKMLTDNALLAIAYAEAFAVAGVQEDADVARRTLRWMARELRTPNGLLGTSLDADSLPFSPLGAPLAGAGAAEGRLYLWGFSELTAALGQKDGPLFAGLYGVTLEGNAESGRSILRPMATRRALAAHPGASWPADAPRGEAFLPWLDGCLQRLQAARAARPQPARDDKNVAAGNGLALSAFARAGALLQDQELTDTAIQLALQIEFQLLEQGTTQLSHQRFGQTSSGEADLADYACVARGFLDASTHNVEHLALAVSLAHALLDRFEDTEGGAFFDTTGSDPHLPGRGRDVWDGAVPAGSSVALEVLLRLAPLDDSGRFATAAHRALARLGPMAEQSPTGFPALLQAVDASRGPLPEIVLDGSGPAYQALRAEVCRTLLPAALLVPQAGRLAAAFAKRGVPEPALVKDRRAGKGEATAWVCVNKACLAPASSVEELREQLRQMTRR